MQVLQKLIYKLNGLYYPQEYLCLAKESFDLPLQIYLADGDRVTGNITAAHAFVGYSPLIIAFPDRVFDSAESPPLISLIFSQKTLSPNAIVGKKDALARLDVALIRRQQTSDGGIHYYEGKFAAHHFVSGFHQYMIRLYNRRYQNKQGNVFLPGNQYTQIQVAYAVPRVISLITVQTENRYNLFPTDLHGAMGPANYVSSLRQTGKACAQVRNSGRILLSEVDCEAYQWVYALGKNHMQEGKAVDEFPFSHLQSAVFGLPVPRSVLRYRELELTDTFDHGIHSLLLYKIVSSHEVQERPVTLAHIHNCYATWRKHQGLPGNYLLR